MAVNDSIDRINIGGDERMIKPAASNVNVAQYTPSSGSAWNPGDVQEALEQLKEGKADLSYFGTVPPTQLPIEDLQSTLRNVVVGYFNGARNKFFDSLGTPAPYATDLLYVEMGTGIIYRWDGSTFETVGGAISHENEQSGSSVTDSTSLVAHDVVTVSDVKTAESRVEIKADGTITRSEMGSSDVTFNLPAESGTLARKEETLPNKTYAPAEFSGLGRKYLQKNIVSDKNVLTQAMVSDANTIYVIQYDYDLNGQSITIPSGIELKFEGGSISNGTLTGASTALSGDIRFGLDVNFSGSFKCGDVDPRWFGAVSATFSADGYAAAQDFALYAAAALKLVSVSNMALYIPAGYWVVKTPIVWTPSFVKIIGEGDRSVVSIYKQSGDYPVCFNFNGATVSGYVRDVYFLRQYIGDDTTTYRGTIFENVVFSAAKISNVSVYRAGIFIRGQIKACTEIAKCHLVNLGYSFISGFAENNFDTSAADTGNAIICIDSFITDNYINAQTSNQSGAITKEKSMLSGAVSSTIVSGNFIDFWKYIIRRVGTAGGDIVKDNIFNGNIFDCCFTFGKGECKPSGLTFINNLIWHCYYNAEGNWRYASNDPDLTEKKWCFLSFASLNRVIISNNTFDEGDYAFKLTPNSYPALYSEVSFPERYMINEPIIVSDFEGAGKDVYINEDKLFIGSDSHLLSGVRLLSTIGFTRSVSSSKTIFDFGSEYYPLQVGNRSYGTFYSADLYDYPSKLSSGQRLHVVVSSTSNPTYDHIIVKETINNEEIYVIKQGSDYMGVVYHDDLFKVASLLPIYSALLILDLNIYVVSIGSTFDFYYGAFEGGATRTGLIQSSLPATAQVGRVAVVMDGDTPVWYKYGYDGWTSDSDTIKKYFPKKNHGTTANRPYCNKYAGMEYFDETIGKKVMWNGSAWVNLDGTALS